jgi:GNAT superfamily N-acetyltransferase
MSAAELEQEIAAGVAFHGWEESGELAGVMGVQSVRDVDLIRHAYILPSFQGRGIGSALLRQFRAGSDRPMLIGTWAAAEWAIAFYRRHGFRLVPANRAAILLRTYWTIPERQARFSVVLADEPDQA